MAASFSKQILYLLFGLVAVCPPHLTAQCGTERWSVKTGTDPDAGLVNLSATTSTTVQKMDALPQPSSLPSNSRLKPTEVTQFVLKATLKEFVLESDSDIHLVLNDSAGNSMIAEIPKPSCVGAGSPFATGITNARTEFAAKYTATSSFKMVNIPVQITGVGFFDFLHGQTGVAPNGVEIHPVLDIIFNPTSGPSFSISSPSSASVAKGASTAVTVTTTVSGGFNSAISLSASGLPSGVSASFNPASIAAPGAGTSTMTLTANTLAKAGTYKVTIMGTGGGLTETATLSLKVTSSGNASFTVTAPASLSVNQGGSSKATVTTAVSGGFNSIIALKAAGMPSGVTAAFKPAKIAAPGSGSSTLTFRATAAAASGSYPITIKGTGGGQSHTTSLNLTVGASGTSFTLSAPSSMVVTQGSSVTANVTSAVSGGFNAAVALSATGMPSGMTAHFKPATIPAPGAGTSVLTVAASSSVTPGDYAITITGTGGGDTQTASLTVTVSSSGGGSQLIKDGGFEGASSSGLTAPGWTATTSVSGHEVIVKGGAYPHSGSNYAELGGAVKEKDTLKQRVTIPAGATSASLTFWANVVTKEASSTKYDYLHVEIHNASGTLLATPLSLSNTDSSSDGNTNGTYFQPAAVDLTSYAGQTIEIVFHATNDYVSPTTFRVDDVSLLTQP